MSSDEERDGVTDNSAGWHTTCEVRDIQRLGSFNTTADEPLKLNCCLRFESGMIVDTIRVASAVVCMGELRDEWNTRYCHRQKRVTTPI
jgi:hypothetical protein